VSATSAGDCICLAEREIKAMPNAKSYVEAAAELRREARRALDPSRRNRLWEYALEYDECAAAMLRSDDPTATLQLVPVAEVSQGG
jgi:hypothetical protein